MADCLNQVGVRNLLLTFTDCDTEESYGPISHILATDELPQLKLCDYNNEILVGGYVRRSKGNNQIDVTVVRNRSVPLAFYQGCAAVDISIEYFDGSVITGLSGTSTGDDTSDGHEVTLSMTFREIDEILAQPLFSANAA